jgi:hypothetical protein
MKKKITPVQLDNIKTYPLSSREHKVNVAEHFAGSLEDIHDFKGFFNSLPRLLAADSMRDVVSAVCRARENGKPVVLAIGGHVIKCGLQPVIKTLIQKEIITAVAMNGSAAIHDFEVSLVGGTSEDVAAVLHSGQFGFAKETGEGMNLALKEGVRNNIGFGEAIGEWIVGKEHPFREFSLLACCHEMQIPATVHVAIGTDIIHQHPEVDGGVTGEMSFRDFRLLTAVISELEGGVWLNVGSAVIMPEVFLKALSIAQNLGHHVENFTTANFDMIQHYRPSQNVVKRPTSQSGRGYHIIGHHEINIPLFAMAILQNLGAKNI